MPGRSISIFLPDGQATGLRTLEIGLSTIKGVYAPRSALEDLGRRPESCKTGIYILIGEDPDSPGRTAIYVGEGDNVFERISEHNKDDSKDFFERLVLFVSKDFNLTKAHIRFLEAQLVSLARESKRATVINSTNPVGGTLPEAERSDMKEFLQQARLLIATLGVTAFELAKEICPVPDSDEKSTSSRSIELETKGKGYNAICLFVDNEYTVLKDSIARKEEADSLGGAYKEARRQLIQSGVLVETPGEYIFTQNYVFPSASYAAKVVSGQSVNGRTAWKLRDSQVPLAQWQDGNEESATGKE